MNDQELWRNAVAQVEKEYMALPASASTAVGEFISVIRGVKRALHSIVEAANGGRICALCRGECCVRGKYHVTVVDLLAYLVSGTPLFTPTFSGDRCPYLGEDGCLMTPEFRPFNCITFNCDRVEGLLEPAEVEKFYLLEKELRRCYDGIQKLLGSRLVYGLLMNYECDVLKGNGRLFGCEQTEVDGLRGD